MRPTVCAELDTVHRHTPRKGLALAGLCWLVLAAACGEEPATSPALDDLDAGVNNGAADVGGSDGATDGGGNNGGSGLSYASDVLPLLRANGCTVCHGETLQQGGHRLDTLENLMTTGAHAPVVVPCESESSALIGKLRPSPSFGDQMPPGGPYMDEGSIAVVARWIDEGAEQGQRCERGEDVGVDAEPPEEPPAVIEERVFRVSARVEMLTGRVGLPEGLEGQSALFALPGHGHHGYVGAGGQVYRVERDGEPSLVPPSWDDDGQVGDVLSVVELPDGTLLISTGTGLLYASDGVLWPSPVSEVLGTVVTGMVAEAVFDRRGRTGLWMATPRGLYVLVDDTLDRVSPRGVRADAAVGPIALGPSASQTGERSLWAAWGSALYALSPDASGVMALSFDVDFGAPILAIATTPEDVWVATDRHVFRRRQGALLGASRWIRWTVPDAQRVEGLVTAATGDLWLLTDQALHRTTDHETWQVALGAPATDVVGLHGGDQGSVWLTRKGELAWISGGPTIGLAGITPGSALSFLPDLSVYPTPADGVASVQLRVDSCAPVELSEAPFEVVGGGGIWSDCLGPGEHALEVTTRYTSERGLPEGRLSVPFGWNARSEQITWHGHIQPMIYGRYCARSGCHIDGFAPDTYETWMEKVDEILLRTETGQMPPNGASPTDVEILLIRWWREDGFLP